MTAIENEFFMQLLDEKPTESVPTASEIPAAQYAPARSGSNKRGYPDSSGGSTYITPPLMRKANAVPAVAATSTATVNASVRTTVMAVKVVEPQPVIFKPQPLVAASAVLPPAALPCTWAVGAAPPRRGQRKVSRKVLARPRSPPLLTIPRVSPSNLREHLASPALVPLAA